MVSPAIRMPCYGRGVKTGVKNSQPKYWGVGSLIWQNTDDADFLRNIFPVSIHVICALYGQKQETLLFTLLGLDDTVN